MWQKAILPRPRQGSQLRLARPLAPAGKNAILVVGSRPDRVCKIELSSNYIEKSGARIRRKRARKRRMAKVTIQLK